MPKEKINAFLDEIKSVNWFERCMIPNEKYHMVFSLYEANDGIWGIKDNEVWETNICPLEDIAVEKIGEFIKRRHLDDQLAVVDELFDSVKRDMSWACVEYLMDTPGFFTTLTSIYKEGYFPCSWGGEYPSGKAVVL